MGAAETVVILAAGQGTRMRSAVPKVLHPLCGRVMLAFVVDQALGLEADRILIVVGTDSEPVRAALAGHPAADRLEFVVQEEQRGTGHALQCCWPRLEELLSGPARPGVPGVVVLYGDMPALRAESLDRLCRAYGEHGASAALLSARPDHPRGFGRILRAGGPEDRSGPLQAIVEERDAAPEILAIDEVNLGLYAFSAESLRRYLPRLSTDNAQGELYLTDVVGLCAQDGGRVAAVVLEDAAEATGVNTLAHLAQARRVLQERILEEHLAAGVHIEDPDTTYIDHGVQIGAGTRVLPCTVIRSGVVIGEGCEVGPFTHLRTGTRLLDGAEVGNFTECKQAEIGAGTKAKHLSYLGNVTIGPGTNVGAGTIVANYDGVAKHPTVIGERAFIGSNSALIAPVRIGADAIVGAGSTVTADVSDGELRLVRAEQRVKPGWADRFHDTMKKKKAAEKAK